MWHFKTTTVPVIMGALGVVKKKTDKRMNEMPSSPRLYAAEKFSLSNGSSA